LRPVAHYVYSDFSSEPKPVSAISGFRNIDFAFVTKLRKSDGVQIFTEVFYGGGNRNNSKGTNLTVSHRGIFVTGLLEPYYTNSPNQFQYYNFNKQLITIPNPKIGGGQVAIVAKLCLDGYQEWFNYAVSTSNVQTTNIVLNDGVYVIGNMSNPQYSFDFNQNQLSPSVTGNLMFVAKLSYSGQQEWFKWTHGNTGYNLTSSIGISSDIVNYDFVISNVIKSNGVYVFGINSPNNDGSYTDFNGDIHYSQTKNDDPMVFVAHILPNGEQTFYKIAGPGMILTQYTLNGIDSSTNDGTIVLTGILQNGSSNEYYNFNNKPFELNNLVGPGYSAFVAKLSYCK
jgi:hypothetical protein